MLKLSSLIPLVSTDEHASQFFFIKLLQIDSRMSYYNLIIMPIIATETIRTSDLGIRHYYGFPLLTDYQVGGGVNYFQIIRKTSRYVASNYSKAKNSRRSFAKYWRGKINYT